MKNLLLSLSLIIPLFLFSQTKVVPDNYIKLELATPESVGMSSERLHRIDAAFQKAIEEQDVPGIVGLVVRKGKVVYHKAFGVSNTQTKKALQTSDIHRIASQTKAITATAVMMLWEEGYFQLDDPIHWWIPEFKNPKVLSSFNYADTTYTSKPASQEITIRHLLTHTAGIGYGQIDQHEGMKLLYAKEGIREIASLTPLTTEENVKKIAKMPLHFNPGEKYQYSMGLDVLAHLVEVISGITFDKFIQQRILDPLGMKDTHFYLPEQKADRLVKVHGPYGPEGSWIPIPKRGDSDMDFPLTASRKLFSGGGGLSSTSTDYAAFLQMYLNGGEYNGQRLLSRTTIQSMMGNQIGNLWGDRGSYYGLAFGVVDPLGQDKGGSGSEGTFSWGGAFNTQYFADPKEEVIGIIFKQTLGGGKDQTGWQFKQLVNQAIISSEDCPPLSTATPDKVGMSAERLNRIDRVMNKAIEEDAIPGGVALVAKNGKIVYHKAFGLADQSKGKALDKDAIFRIASQTKAITATAVMMLWEEGHFRLDDPIYKWIPEFKQPQVLKKFRYSDNTYTSEPAKDEITIRHLLTHTSGIGYGVIDPHEGMRRLYKEAGIQEFASQTDWTTADNIKKLASLPLHFNPGEKWQYGMGLDVLVYFVEIVSGQSFDVFLKERLFDPLGMEDTYFHLPQEKANRLVTVQFPKDGKWHHQPVTSYDPAYPLTGNRKFCSGGGGLVSTAVDYATFLQMYLNKGKLNGHQILSPTTIRAIMGNQIGDFWGDGGRYYGLAFGVLDKIGQDKGGQGSIGTFDWGGYFNTQYFADPKEGVIGILMKQTQGTTKDKTGWQFRQLVGQAIND